MKNLGTLGALMATLLLLGHGISSGSTPIAHASWKLIGFLVAGIISIAVFLLVGRKFESPVLSWLSGGVTMLVLLVMLGALA